MIAATRQKGLGLAVLTLAWLPSAAAAQWPEITVEERRLEGVDGDANAGDTRRDTRP